MYVNKFSRLGYVFLTSITMILGGSCSNEIDIFTDYKEQAAVYSFLDLGSDVQFIRVGRTFLNPGIPASAVAKEADSIYFRNLIVKLIHEQSGNEFTFQTTDTIPKDTGYFAHVPNLLYANQMQLMQGGTYRLIIQNPETGYTASGRTSIVEAPIVSFPVSPSNPNLSISPFLDIQLRFFNGRNARSHNAVFDFWVEEFPKSDTTQKTVSKLSWRFANNIRNEQLEPNNRVRTTPGINFYEFFKNSLPIDTSRFRRIIRTDFILYSASQDLTDFIDASTPSIGIVQKQTDFSNIENGIGIFTSRHTFKVKNIALDPATIAFFNALPDYKDLQIIR